MSGVFAHAAPEQQLNAPQSYNSLRRHELHKIAVEKGILKPSFPTPIKDVLVAMLEGTIPAPESADDILATMDNPVPLAEAHLDKRPGVPVTDELEDLF